MAKPMNSTQLINTALRRGLIPVDQATFTCSDLREIANEEISIHVIPMVMRVHEEYYVVDEDIPICSCVVRYKIPYRAMGNNELMCNDYQLACDLGNEISCQNKNNYCD